MNGTNIQSKRLKKLLLFTFVVTITILFGVLVLRMESRKSLSNKRIMYVASLNEINAAAQNIPIKTSSSIQTSPSFHSRANLLLEEIEALKHPNISLAERLFFNKEIQKLEAMQSIVVNETTHLSNSISELQERVSTLEKFINYQVSADFIDFGRSQELDDERIERSIVGITTILDNPHLLEFDVATLSDAIDSFEKIRNTSNLDELSSEIHSQRTLLLNAINDSLKEIVDRFSEQLRNNIIYQ